MTLITTYADIFRNDKLKQKFEEVDATIQIAEIELSAANIIAMNGAPVELVAAPGAGKVLELVGATFILDYDTTQFTGGGDVVIQEETSATALTSVLAEAVVLAAADSITKVLPVAATLVENKAIEISNATAAFATGDSVMRVKVSYRTHTIGL